MGKTRGLVCLFLVFGTTASQAGDSLKEWIDLQERVNQSVKQVRTQYKRENLRLGLGWWGNVSRLGPRCDDVAYRVEEALSEAFRRVKLHHYRIVLLFDAGMLPKDLLAHVYFGVASKKSGRLLYCFDPWRYGNGRLRDHCPNMPEEMHVVIE